MDVYDPDGRKLFDPLRGRGNAADIDNPAITPDTIRSLWQGETLDLATTVATEAVEVVIVHSAKDSMMPS